MRDTRSPRDRRATPPTKDSPRCADCAISCAAMRAPPRGDACCHRPAWRSGAPCRCKFYPVHHKNCTRSRVPPARLPAVARPARFTHAVHPTHAGTDDAPTTRRRRVSPRRGSRDDARRGKTARAMVSARIGITAVVRAADTARGPRGRALRAGTSDSRRLRVPRPGVQPRDRAALRELRQADRAGRPPACHRAARRCARS